MKTPDLDTLRAAVTAAQTELDASTTRLATYEAQLAPLTAAVAAHTEAERAAAAWRVESAQLGAEPVVPQQQPRPTPPEAPRPEAGAVALARDVLASVTRAEGARQERVRALATARRQAEADAKAAADTAAEAARLDAYVEALRRAPSLIARRQAEALGDLGPVTVDFHEDGVRILIDGRPWDGLQSTGRLALAGLYIQLAIRRLAKMVWLPVIADGVQDWSGDWPAAAPMIGLRTTAAPVARVTAFGAELSDEDLDGAAS